MKIKEMVDRTGWTIKRFSDYFGIPYRSVQNWISGSRECPAYLESLIEYKLTREGFLKADTDEEKSPSP